MTNNIQDQDIDLQAMGLFDDGEEAVDTSLLPKERSGLVFTLPQPGTLVLRMPGNITPAAQFGTGDSDKVFSQVSDSEGSKRLQVKFREEYALLMQPSGAPLSCNITDFRNKDKNGVVSGEFLQFVAKGLGYTGTIASKADLVAAVLSGLGKDFKADVSYTATCSADRAVWKDGAKSDSTGCGQKYDMRYQKFQKRDGTEVVKLQIPQGADGKWLSRFVCLTPGCGADVSAFLKLSNYRGVK